MIEVFKTDVTGVEQANLLIEHIHRAFADHEANFDLHDRDRILRVKCNRGSVQTSFLVTFLKDHGCEAEVLPD